MRATCLFALLLAGPAAADLEVTFRDGAPKDRFSITNSGTCDLSAMSVLIDLSSSPAGLIFDVTPQGQGVEVYQPLEVTSGAMFIDGISTVRDGDQWVQLDLSGLPAQAFVTVTSDLDDTIGAREITVSGAEIAGARVIIGTAYESTESVFDETGVAIVRLPSCLS